MGVCRTLAQYLAQQDLALGLDREREVLVMFQQIVAAIRHIHQHNILHRSPLAALFFLSDTYPSSVLLPSQILFVMVFLLPLSAV